MINFYRITIFFQIMKMYLLQFFKEYMSVVFFYSKDNSSKKYFTQAIWIIIEPDSAWWFNQRSHVQGHVWCLRFLALEWKFVKHHDSGWDEKGPRHLCEKPPHGLGMQEEIHLSLYLGSLDQFEQSQKTKMTHRRKSCQLIYETRVHDQFSTLSFPPWSKAQFS